MFQALGARVELRGPSGLMVLVIVDRPDGEPTYE